LFGFY
jgi:hypothetical protein